MTASPTVQGTLALDFPLPSGLPAVPQAPALTVVVGGADLPMSAPGSTPPPLPPRDWAGRFVQAVVEVVAGDRPLQQLVRWTNERVYADLSRRVRVLGLTTSAAARHRTERSHVRSVHIHHPPPPPARPGGGAPPPPGAAAPPGAGPAGGPAWPLDLHRPEARLAVRGVPVAALVLAP